MAARKRRRKRNQDWDPSLFAMSPERLEEQGTKNPRQEEASKQNGLSPLGVRPLAVYGAAALCL